MKKAVLFLAACLVSANAFAQEIPEVPEPDESKFQVIRDLSDKTTSIGGEAPFYATDKVACGQTRVILCRRIKGLLKPKKANATTNAHTASASA